MMKKEWNGEKKTMRALLHVLENCAADTDKWIYTILTGRNAGKKTLLEDGKICWLSDPEDSFFEEHRNEFLENQEKGCQEIAGERIFAEHIGSRPKLVICGGGHVSAALICVAKLLELQIIVLEDRLSFAAQAKAAGADQVICDAYEHGLEQIRADGDTYFVIVTRGHRYDQTCLEKISRMPHAYIGMMGSKRRVAIVKQGAVDHGADPEVIRQVHAPIGLDIKAETPEEIAVSILAEIISEKGKRNSGTVFTDEITRALCETRQDSGQKMLATIITKKGSAPRAAGTKMVIFQDGTTAGTIGGGCMEAAVIQRARALMMQPDSAAVLFQEKLTTEEAEKEGMVCGGVLELFLETVR